MMNTREYHGWRILNHADFILSRKKLTPVFAQAAQIVIYIRDSIALRLNHLRECMKMVRKSL